MRIFVFHDRICKPTSYPHAVSLGKICLMTTASSWPSTTTATATTASTTATTTITTADKSNNGQQEVLLVRNFIQNNRNDSSRLGWHFWLHCCRSTAVTAHGCGCCCCCCCSCCFCLTTTTALTRNHSSRNNISRSTLHR